jgi:hypothetical protein
MMASSELESKLQAVVLPSEMKVVVHNRPSTVVQQNRHHYSSSTLPRRAVIV